MKGTPRSLFLSAANRATGWWWGHAANAMRRGQAAWLAAATKAGDAEAKARQAEAALSGRRDRPEQSDHPDGKGL